MKCYNKINKDLLVPSLAVPNSFFEEKSGMICKESEWWIGKLEDTKIVPKFVTTFGRHAYSFQIFPPKLQKPHWYKGKL